MDEGRARWEQAMCTKIDFKFNFNKILGSVDLGSANIRRVVL